MVRLSLFILALSACCNSLPESGNHISGMTQENEPNLVQSVYCCLDSILKEVDGSLEKTPISVNVEFKGEELRVGSDEKITISHNKVRYWLQETAIQDSIVAFRLPVGNKGYYLFSSPIKQATGIAVNFTSWLIVDADRNFVMEIESLSNSQKAFYLEKATGNLSFTSFGFAESFIHQKDFGNIVFKQEHYSITKEGKRLIREEESPCYCK